MDAAKLYVIFVTTSGDVSQNAKEPSINKPKQPMGTATAHDHARTSHVIPNTAF